MNIDLEKLPPIKLMGALRERAFASEEEMRLDEAGTAMEMSPADAEWLI
jgi:hypothetical protein